jgi:hypothetical protein
METDMTDVPQLERVRYFAGELLTADDLTTEADYERQMRWLHNRSLHGWGIGFGLDVLGSRGDTSVTVNPGYAVDSDGHEIILSGAIQLPIPAVPGGSGGAAAAVYYLVANYVADADEPALEQRDAAPCMTTGGSVRLGNAPAIRWKLPSQLQTGLDVVLGEISIKNCVLAAAVSTAPRRYARSRSALAIYAGELTATEAQWQSWLQGAVNIGFTVAVDTSAARFNTTPLYTAEIIGARTLEQPPLVVTEFVSITNAQRDGFTLQVALPNLSASVNQKMVVHPVTGPKLLARLGWRIGWIGVEG